MKAILIVEWKDGTPQLPELPEGMEILGISAMEDVTTNGTIRAMIEATEDVIEELKSHLEFINYIIDELEQE